MVPGTVIADRYRVVRLLGEGGMGAVYEGEHIAVGRKVAIKVLHQSFSKREGVAERFEREARAAAAIGHENIIEVFDFGVHRDEPYMVMEYLRGEGLGAKLARERKLPIELGCTIMGQVLSALAAAHAAGIIHRDLKPDNVFLIARGANREFVKLLDFGISKVVQKAGSEKLTRDGTLMGTPQYMAPEQAMARSDIDGRADVYSAGVMLYEMLVGEVPFDADSEAEILIKICQRSSEPRAPCDIDPSIPMELDAVVRRAIAFDRDDRYQSADEFLDALRPFGAWSHSNTDPGVSGSHHNLDVNLSAATVVGTPTAWTTIAASSRTLSGEVPRPQRSQSRVPFGIASVVAAGLAFTVLALARQKASPPVTAAHAEVQIEIAGIPDDGEVSVDGRRTTDRVMRLRRGSTHRLRVTAPNHQAYESSFSAERTETMHIALAPVQPPAPVEPVVVPPPDSIGAAPVAPAANVVLPGAAPAVATALTQGEAPAGPEPEPRGNRPARARVRRPAARPTAHHGNRPAGSLMPATEEY